jgi:hypothetical protein
MKNFALKKTPYVSCPVGRPFNLAHATCKSCPIECRERNGKKPVEPKERQNISVHVVGNRLITTLYLDSLNAWNNKPRYLYTNIRNRWQKVLHNAVYIWGRPEGKRVLQVRRLVRDKRCLILDRDNLIGSLKPVKDVLTRCQVLIDDSDEFLDFTVEQDVDAENPRTEIILT